MSCAVIRVKRSERISVSSWKLRLYSPDEKVYITDDTLWLVGAILSLLSILHTEENVSPVRQLQPYLDTVAGEELTPDRLCWVGALGSS